MIESEKITFLRCSLQTKVLEMRLYEFAKRIKPSDVITNASRISGDLLITDLTKTQVENLTDIILITDDEGEILGKIQKELLEYLTEKRRDVALYLLLNKIPDGVIAVDEAGRIFYANEAYTTLLDVPRRRIIGKKIQEIEPESMLCKTLLTKEAQTSEKQLIASLNRYVSLHTHPIVNKGRFHGAISIFHDVTEILELNQQVEKISGIADEYGRQLQSLSTIHAMGVVTRSRDYLKILSEAALIAKTDVPVLIRGENGVGKEVLANYIYNCSDRKDRPLITVNCAAIPAELLESELFGYEDGAFTGAKKGGKKGQFELADKGTIFLDEIGDMPISMQSKLLRVIQSGEIEKLGRQKRITVDVRIIAATNQNLESMITNKSFRQDLFFRLNTFSLTIPPLRNRTEDIPLLANYFLQYYNEKYNKDYSLSAAAYKKLIQNNWPGNVRELQGYIERCVVLETDSVNYNLSTDKLDSTPPEEILIDGTLHELLSLYEKRILCAALDEANGNKTQVIEKLGISRRTLFRKLSEHNLN